jgi:hypothetical protein
MLGALLRVSVVGPMSSQCFSLQVRKEGGRGWLPGTHCSRSRRRHWTGPGALCPIALQCACTAWCHMEGEACTGVPW